MEGGEEGNSKQSKIRELLAKRKERLAAEQAKQKTAEESATLPNPQEQDKDEQTTVIKPAGGDEKPKAAGRAEFFARLRQKKLAEVGGVAQGSSEESVNKPSSRAEMMARLLAKKKAQLNPAGCSGDVSDGKSTSGVSHNNDDIEELKRLMEAAKMPHAISQDRQKGVKGREFQASANIVKLILKEDMGVFEYHCRFEPDIDSIKERKHIIRQLLDTIGETRIFDGTILCLPKLLETALVVLTATCTSGESVKVTLKLVKRRNLANCLQLFNVLVGKMFEHLKMVEIKRNYYDPSARMMVPQHKLEIWPGYVNRVHETDGGLMLICDTRNKVLRRESAYEIIKDVQKKGGRVHEIEKAIIGSVVMTEYNKASTYKIEDINFEMNPLSTFQTYSGEEITYKDYYAQRYNIEVKDLKQPLLVYREKRKQAGEETTRTIMLIPELCRMTGLTDAMISDFRVMKDVAAHTRVTPEQRQASLKKFLKNVRGNPDCVKLLAQWGLEMDTEPIRLTGRTLESEKLLMGNSKQFTVNFKCDWGRESTSNTCLVPVHLKCWHVVTTDRNQKLAEGFISLMKTLAPRMGMQVGQPTLSILKNDRSETFVQDIRANINNNTQCVVIIVPQQREDRYATVKRLCNTDLPVASQVICAKTISNEKKVQSVVQKIALQINCKLGGELWGCKIPVQNFMVVGMDVYHDPSRKKESVLGAVASVNSTLSKWVSVSEFQRPGQELVDVMMTCLGTLVTTFKEINGVAPEKIILYRDGVGDGQLDAVDFYEAERCQKLFKTLQITPEFAFIVVQKRINRRLFEVKGNKYENPAPGSVLDHTVMKKNFLDFILVSQHSSQSVVTPTHYVIVKNSTSFSVDQIQKLSYKLTHQYFNWPGTIRVPAPCQYAHKLAYQIGESTRALPHPLLTKRLFFL